MLHTAPLTLDEREAVLLAALPRYSASGWRVTAQTLTTVHLVRRRQFDVAIALFWTLLCGFGLFIYIAAHFARGDEAAMVMVDEAGTLHEHIVGAR